MDINKGIVIDQMHGNNWVSYCGDCCYVMDGLPPNSIDFSIFSPPFLALYIYSDSIADLGNTDSEKQFFDGWLYHLQSLYRTLKPGHSIAIHCKDTMRYKTSNNYAGLFDFPGEIIRCAGNAGFVYTRWITIWKDPVIEMQRTKTYGLLHKSFAQRGEVTRQGCADFVLIFTKPENKRDRTITNYDTKTLPESVIDRCKHQWTMKNETIESLSIWDKPLYFYTDEMIDDLSNDTTPGRLAVIHCQDLPTTYDGGFFSMQSEVIKRFEAQGSWKFHSRVALTDDTSLVVFRNWTKEHKRNYKQFDGAVTHSLKAPGFLGYETVKQCRVIGDDNLDWVSADEFNQMGMDSLIETREIEQAKYNYDIKNHRDYIGTSPPQHWRDDSYYSILVWQRYASPVWNDLDGLPNTSSNCWMTINQTNVLNVGLKSEKEQRHICPLQLDLIEQCIVEYTDEDDIVITPYGGIGSEGVKSIELKRKAILSELKPNYWEIGCQQLHKAELKNTQLEMF